MKYEVAEGTWCRTCEFFEEEDFVEGTCIACGCPTSSHSAAVVVTNDA